MKRRFIPILILILVCLTMKLSFNFVANMTVVAWNRPIVVDDLNFTVLDVTEDPLTAGKRHLSARVRIVSQARRASFAYTPGFHCFDETDRDLGPATRMTFADDQATPVTKLAFIPGKQYVLNLEYEVPSETISPRLGVGGGTGWTDILDRLMMGRTRIELRPPIISPPG